MEIYNPLLNAYGNMLDSSNPKQPEFKDALDKYKNALNSFNASTPKTLEDFEQAASDLYQAAINYGDYEKEGRNVTGQVIEFIRDTRAVVQETLDAAPQPAVLSPEEKQSIAKANLTRAEAAVLTGALAIDDIIATIDDSTPTGQALKEAMVKLDKTLGNGFSDPNEVVYAAHEATNAIRDHEATINSPTEIAISENMLRFVSDLKQNANLKSVANGHNIIEELIRKEGNPIVQNGATRSMRLSEGEPQSVTQDGRSPAERVNQPG